MNPINPHQFPPAGKPPKYGRPLSVTIISIFLMLLGLGLLFVLLVGGLFSGLVVSTGVLILILTFGIIAIILQIIGAIGMLLMKKWALLLIFIVFAISLIKPVEELFSGIFIWQSFALPVILFIVIGYLYTLRNRLN